MNRELISIFCLRTTNYQLPTTIDELRLVDCVKRTQFPKEKMNITPALTRSYEYAPLTTLRETNPILPALRSFSVGGSPLADSSDVRQAISDGLRKMKNEPNFLASQNEHKPSYNKGLRE